MSNEVKSKIYQLIDSIEDENILQMVMEDVVYYAGKKDITDELSKEQLGELDESISEADNNETIVWHDFKNEMNEWKNSGFYITQQKLILIQKLTHKNSFRHCQ